MALSMVHLLAAEKWATGRDAYYNCPEFYLGAIGPDAMHVRYGDDKSHKDEFHLYNWVSPDLGKVRAYWGRHFTPFDVGYGIHVLTDGHWIPYVKAAFPEMINPQGRLAPKMYYNDVYQTDFEIYRSHPDRARIFDLLRRAHGPEDHPLLTRGEFEAWREMQFALYAGQCPYDGAVERIDIAFIRGFLDRILPILNTETGRYLQ